MPDLRCPKCSLPLTDEQVAAKVCPSCGTISREFFTAADSPAKLPSPVTGQTSQKDPVAQLQLFLFVHGQLEKGYSSDQIENQLLEQGLDSLSARSLVRKVAKARSSLAGQKNMFIGGGICIFGLIISLISYNLAIANGWTSYSIAIGAVVVGALQFLYGVVQLMFGSS
jgi:hypothetical protein